MLRNPLASGASRRNKHISSCPPARNLFENFRRSPLAAETPRKFEGIAGVPRPARRDEASSRRVGTGNPSLSESRSRQQPKASRTEAQRHKAEYEGLVVFGCSPQKFCGCFSALFAFFGANTLRLFPRGIRICRKERKDLKESTTAEGVSRRGTETQSRIGGARCFRLFPPQKKILWLFLRALRAFVRELFGCFSCFSRVSLWKILRILAGSPN